MRHAPSVLLRRRETASPSLTRFRTPIISESRTDLMRLSMTRCALAALAFSTACATTAPDDDPTPSQLDRLRVLAIAADPPDLVPGESATLRALVFTPEDRAVDY